jgi:hypothetical protein
MRNAILMMLLAVVSSSAAAAWNLDGRGEELTVYTDSSTIRRNGKMAKMWVLYDFDKPRVLNGAGTLSRKTLGEYDCKSEQSRTLSDYWYEGQMGNGRLVISETKPGTFSAIIPDSVSEAMWKFACGKK